ncbi:MAG: 23S rRNA (adenine(2503)-C(2))-methyltransferase RlmN [Tissierellaceae bacterium]|jgi:23S rRNA (adenine2503-C2)-methyltransferase|nr:23S rRNA (adenine(2503)-C(2))-methyltransferase RlmN [Tissierellia bacterium]
MIELNSLSLDELRDYMISIGEKPFRGEQLFSYFHRNMGLSMDDIHILPMKLRQELKESAKVNRVRLLKRLDSKIDNTKKYLFLLEDNNIIESVLMEHKHGLTVCISTQVGCRMGCSFCASTKEGRIRDLSPSEMLNQVYSIEKDIDKKISNIVLMGSGEPLDNYDNTMKFLDIIHHPKGHNLSYRNITLSTCGLVPEIYDLAEEDLPITLSISLHSPFDDIRMKMMPVARKYKIKDLMEACRHYEARTGRRLTFEYTLIEGVNDRREDVDELGRILRGLNSHINLIPLNPIKEYKKARPSISNIERFQRQLLGKNIQATIRQEKGEDISAACGQLRRDYLSQG